MPKIKYDLRDVEAAGGFDAPPPGLYRAKLTECNQTKSNAGNDMLECVYELTRGDYKGSKVWDYIVLGVEGFPERKLRQFLEAVEQISGSKNAKGSFDPDEFEDSEVQLRLKNETYEDEPRARVAAVLPLPEEDEDEEEIEEEEETEDEEGEDEEGAGEEYTYEDLEGMDLKELKEVNDEEELGIRITKKSKVETVLAKVAEALELEPEEAEEEEDEDEEEEVDYSDMSPEELKAELKDRGLKTAGKKAVLIARLEKDDEEAEDPFE